MEKRGVTEGEGEAPPLKKESKDKAAEAKEEKPAEKSCGDDLLSKLADIVSKR